MSRADDPSFLDACARTLIARTRARRDAARRRADVLRDRARLAAAALAERHGATRVWLFGSLAWGEPHEASDVDLLVEGVASADWSVAGRTAEDVVDGTVDLVLAQEAPPSLMVRVRREGVLLHGTP